jgi:hypothetical protein
MESAKPPRKKKSAQRQKPGVIAFWWIVKIFGVVASGILIALAWRTLTSPTARTIFRNMRAARDRIHEETNAPGARELRKAGPCTSVIVLSATTRAAHREEGHQKSKASDPPPDATLIVCQAAIFVAAPTCDDLARTYVDTAHPDFPFRVRVNVAFDPKSGCSTDYDSSGKRAPKRAK